MRILHVNKFLYRRGGAEGYMLDLAELQRGRGDEVSFFAMEHPDNQADPNADLFPPRMELNPPPSGVAARIATSVDIVYRRSARIGMDAILDRVRPDVVHLHNIYHQLSPSILRPVARRGIPTVMTLHDYKLACPTYQFLDNGKICEACVPRKFRHAALKACNGSRGASALAAIELTAHTVLGAYKPVDVFICPSDFMLRKMREAKVFPDRLTHIPHFSDLSRIEPATAPGRGVLFAGRLSSEKGVDTLIDAAALLPEGIPVTIAGDGPDVAELRMRAERAGVSDRVTFAGRLPSDELHQRMREAAVVVAPSRWYENQPMVVLEAFGAARPVVATHLGGFPELITNGVSGLLVQHDDPVALAFALTELATDPVRAHEMGAAAHRGAIDRFAIDRHLERLDQAYATAANLTGGVLHHGT
ncbi:glycosyltransferase family 4 protein [Nocardioides bizhenqiangii]|uniref:Glycosyltransferase family 4 protein n=1 Tax=Nocardioides bizhenqiangii TaxID=3095076 RepID=A0ABZ0ZNH3_9ACTN|nr:glycosyltransferase family 4 protein [Nocardioides sp. HM61]WQQ25635.1 glycosyltransferase family 4 protein [Nocardioides sp. HM61]